MKNKSPKTMRTANIRVFQVNSTSQGEVSYSDSDFMAKVQEVLERYPNSSYAFIKHDKDVSPDGPVLPHFHLVFKFSGHARFETLKKIFPYGSIETCGSLNASVQYLLHKNSPEKFQYDASEIQTNFSASDLEVLLTENDNRLKKLSEKKILQDISDLIKSGVIRDFNLSAYIDENGLEIFYSKYKNQIENLLQLNFKRLMIDSKRDIKVIFIHGPSGTGKTTFVDYLTKDYNGVCISSADNDMWQDYGGQDVMVLDDFRDSNLAYHELLKMIDNNKRSSVRGRYRNKSFSGKLIIITSVIPLHRWYEGKQLKGDDLFQLYRRVNLYLTMSEEEIIYSSCTSTGRAGREIKRTDNPTYLLYKNSDNDSDSDLDLDSFVDSLSSSVASAAKQMGVEVKNR